MTDNAPQGDPGTDLTGRSLGGCVLSRRLGKGAMGTVYLAEQTALRRTVAVKVLAPRYASDPGYTERFLREAQAAAQLSHPNIVQVFEFGNEGPLYFMVNEYVDGGNVQELLDRKRSFLPVETAIDIVLQAAQGLTAAEEKGVIHRDIKPENLMLTEKGDDDSATVKIADFGLAKAARVDPDAAVTQAGFIMGTPFYMSPEQAKNQPLDIRADIYSLGVTFYYLLTGALPFDADSVIGVLLKQISAERPDPSAANPAVPPLMGALVMRMMAKDAADRPSDASELVRELERIKRGITQPKAAAELSTATEVVGDQRSQFKPLGKSLVRQVNRLDVTRDVLERMIMSLNSDSGHFIEMDQPMPVNTAVEVRFTAPGKDDEFSGIGLVRWNTLTPGSGQTSPGMGVTFIKVQVVPKGDKGAAGQSTMRLTGPMAIHALTRSPLHQRLLRYVYSNSGQTQPLSTISGALGCGVKMIQEPLALFERADLARMTADGKVELRWPEDPALQREIVAWIDRNGL